ncbi:hypothetical protein Q4519_08825 [Motilimonas sp. 1_MG-2023]|uniref:hypothetical protein n=1 Tax=Motilimonas sp. 1_MG-2023 TaxID=3062672 RepID=UPI0026E24F3A|nr:hypothetical protein [Motilimonas sp. 1_MG-2023]MDO6525787.1 hypothetical protein [Motilimonas sp. 1_MG-2023]
MNVNTLQPSRELYNQVRAAFILKGSSLSSWCGSNDIKQQNAMSCLVGTWNGPKGKALREKLIMASGISELPELKQAV